MVAAIAEKKKVQCSCGNYFPAILANAATTIAEIRLFLSQFFLSQTLTRLFQLAQCWQIFLELSKRLYWSLGKKKKVVFCSRLPQDREIRHFHVVVVQRRQWNKQKRVIQVQSCCFADLNLFLTFSLTTVVVVFAQAPLLICQLVLKVIVWLHLLFSVDDW